MARCPIWYQTLKDGVPMVGQNAILRTTLERLSQESVSLNQFVWHSNSYLTCNHLRGMHLSLEWYANRISRKISNCSIRKVL